MDASDATTSENEQQHRLVAFSATAGVGFFLYQQTTHRFDLIADQIDGIEFNLAIHSEFGVVPCFLTFPTRRDLLAYATREYLRAKKAEYFTAVFARELPRGLFIELLTFLDDADLLNIPLSVDFRRRLEDVASPPQVIAVVGETSPYRFRNLLLTLEVEFGELLHSERIQFLAELPRWVTVEPEWVPSQPWPLSGRMAERVWSGLAHIAASKQLSVPGPILTMPLEPADPEKLSALLALIRRTVRGVVGRYRYPGPTDVNDLVQEVTMSLFAAAARGQFPYPDGPSLSALDLRAYVSRICSNKLIDSFRRAHRRSTTVSLDLQFHDQIDPESEIEDNLLPEERRELVREAIATLSEAEQHIIQMYYFEERRLDDIARLLNISVAGVYRRHKTALQRLREVVLGEGRSPRVSSRES